MRSKPWHRTTYREEKNLAVDDARIFHKRIRRAISIAIQSQKFQGDRAKARAIDAMVFALAGTQRRYADVVIRIKGWDFGVGKP